MWSRKGLTPEQALSYLDELEGLSEILRRFSASNSTSEIQTSDTTLENSLSVASCSYKTSDVKRSNSSDLTVTKNKPQKIPCHRNVQSKSNLIKKKKKGFLLEENQACTSKDGTKWKGVSANKIRAVKTAQRNILKDNPGPTFYAKQKTNKDKISTFWRLFVDNHTLKIIKNCTETEANNKLENVDWKLSFEDLDAFIAILYARGAYAFSKLELENLRSIKWGPPFFRETMSKNRFKEIMKFLRFDIRATRRERLQHDKFALVSDIWNRFIYNCEISYVTVDEQLFPTKVRCVFTQYMSNKPNKFGIKFWIAVDTKSKYVLNAFPYLGKDKTGSQNQALSENVVLRLLEPFTKKGRNVTTDNFFTSVKLAEKLAKLNTTIVGTMNRFRREVPELVKSSRGDLYETVLLKTDNDNCILTVYQAKPNKNVRLLSTLHTSITINTDEEKKKPETVLYYNDTKYGVDVADQMARKYTELSYGLVYEKDREYNSIR
ncbi:hypothetical protein ILUMI_22645 [Ignelater luminosus]|uniref:PiggyBac transposable element-derived protein domain-containing protein n=1 Tax=Ignelater luminosus TaxID=2038154 RepID=A0A8K0G2M0_IGNLU|nr:hypothetical protein ILUMI_22645 [Ignelater luminosus]